MKHRTATLDGALLDAAASRADGCADGVVLPYSSDWQLGGLIIDRELIAVVPVWAGKQREPWMWDMSDEKLRDEAWEAMLSWEINYDRNLEGEHQTYGPTPLIAAMRAFVASKLGPEVELP